MQSSIDSNHMIIRGINTHTRNKHPVPINLNVIPQTTYSLRNYLIKLLR